MACALVIAAHGTMRAHLRDILREGGWPEVAVAATFAAADQILAEVPVELIVSELVADDGTALELLDALRERPDEWAGAPVVLLTAEQQAQPLVSALDLGADAVLLHPVTGQQLLQRTEEAYARFAALRPLWRQWHDPEPEAVAQLWATLASHHPRWRTAAARLAGRLFERAGDWGRALEHYEAHRAKAPPPWVTLGQIRCYIAYGEYGAARALLAPLLAHHPQLLDGWAEWARLAELTNAPDEAQTAYERLLAAPLDRRRLHAALPQLLASGAHPLVRRAVDQWGRYYPHPTAADRLFLVLAYHETGRPEQAHRLAHQLLNDAKAPDERAIAHFAHYLIAYRLGALPEALDALRLALYFLEEAPLPHDLPEWLLRLLLAALTTEVVQGEAILLLYRVRRVLSEHLPLMRLRTLLAHSGLSNLWEQAETELAEAAKRWVGQAKMQSQQGDWLGALETLSRAAAALPGSAALHFQQALTALHAVEQGVLARAAGEEVARRALRQLRRLAPTHPGLTRLPLWRTGAAPPLP